MAKDTGKTGKGKQEEKEEPKGRGNAGNLKPKEKVVIPADLLKRIKKERPDVYKMIEDLNKARESGDDTDQRKARMALRNAGFYLSKLEAGDDPFVDLDEKKKEEKAAKKDKKEEQKSPSKKAKVLEEEEEEEGETEGGEDEVDFDAMDRDELKEYIAENELDVTVKKSMSDDDIRSAIQKALK